MSRVLNRTMHTLTAPQVL